MATYLIQGTVTDWPESTEEIEFYFQGENEASGYELVDMISGDYSAYISADPGEKIWCVFTGWKSSFSEVTTVKAFGPFIIDDIGVTE